MTPKSLIINKSMFMIFRKFISIVILLAFISTSIQMPAYSQATGSTMPWMPVPGTRVSLSAEFTPAHLKGLVIHPENPLKFDFIIYKGDESLSDQDKQTVYKNLIKYFMASLAVPDENQWVNLSPYEKNRIVEDDFGKTEMGRDLLAQDYLLKQITASLIYPEDELGKKFWDKVYTQAQQQFGSTDIPVNTFNKVWIVPDDALVYESGNTVYVLKNHLKVMLEEDYLAMGKNNSPPFMGGARGGLNQRNYPLLNPPHKGEETNSLGSQIVREIVLPALEKEINEGKNFAMLRQVYSGMILAAWYKRALKESLLGKIYANKAKVNGINQDPKNNEAIYQQYIKAYKKGVFNYIKEDTDKFTHQPVPRKYFSGGTKNDYAQVMRRTTDSAMARSIMLTEAGKLDAAEAVLAEQKEAAATMRRSNVNVDSAMVIETSEDVVFKETSPRGNIYEARLVDLPEPIIIVVKNGVVKMDDISKSIFENAKEWQEDGAPITTANVLDSLSFRIEDVAKISSTGIDIYISTAEGEFVVNSTGILYKPNFDIFSTEQKIELALTSLRGNSKILPRAISNIFKMLRIQKDLEIIKKSLGSYFNNLIKSKFGVDAVDFDPVTKLEGNQLKFLGIVVADVTPQGTRIIQNPDTQEFANALANYLEKNLPPDAAMTTASMVNTKIVIAPLPQSVRNLENKKLIDTLLRELVSSDPNFPNYVQKSISPDRLEDFDFIVAQLKQYPPLTSKILDGYYKEILGMFTSFGKQAGFNKRRFRDFWQEVFMEMFSDAAMTQEYEVDALRRAVEDLRGPGKKRFIDMINTALEEEAVQDVNDPAEFMGSIVYMVYAFVLQNYSINMFDELKVGLTFKDNQFKWFGVLVAEISSDRKGIRTQIRNGEQLAKALADYLERKLLVDSAMTKATDRSDAARIPREVSSLPGADKRGGIDFNAANLNLQIKRDGTGVPLPISQQNLENIHIDGLVPIIIDIKPAVTLPMFAELEGSSIKPS